MPVSDSLVDSCTGEPFMFTGVYRMSFQLQTDGTFKMQTYLNGTGVSLSGVQYTSGRRKRRPFVVLRPICGLR
jgi:hypothetical protein